MIGFVLSNSGSSTLVSTRITGTGACDSAGFGWVFLEVPKVMQIVALTLQYTGLKRFQILGLRLDCYKSKTLRDFHIFLP